MLVRKIRHGQCIDIAPNITLWPHPAHRRRWFTLAIEAPRIMPILVSEHRAGDVGKGMRRETVELTNLGPVRFGDDVAITAAKGYPFLVVVELPAGMVIEAVKEAVGCTA